MWSRARGVAWTLFLAAAVAAQRADAQATSEPVESNEPVSAEAPAEDPTATAGSAEAVPDAASEPEPSELEVQGDVTVLPALQGLEGEPGEERQLFGILVTTGAAHDDGAPILGGAPSEETPPTEPAPEPTTDEARVGDTEPMVYLARATVVLDRRPSERTGVNAAYEGEFERYGEGHELDALNHAFGFAFEHRPSRRAHWFVGGSLLDGEDPGRFLSGVLTILPRSDYRQSRVYSSFSYLWPSSALALSVGRLQTEIAATAFAHGVPTDDTDLYGALTYDVALGARNALSASYSYVRPQSGVIVRVDPLDPEGPPLLEEREPYHAATLGLIHRRGATLAFEISAGVAGDSDESTGIGAIEVRRTGDVYTLRVRYDRTLAALGSDPAGARTPTPVETGLPDRVASDSVTQGLRFGVEVSLTDRWQLEQSVWLARTDLSAGDELETLALSGRLVFRLASRVGLFGEVDYFDQGGLAGPFVSSRLRYGVGLVFSVAGPGGERGLLAQRESALRVLPNRGGT